MSRLPLIALVGRPNVGKSTLFNRWMGWRSAIVFDQPGVTRDRHYGIAEIEGRRLQLVDTGGFAPGEQEGMLPLMRRQAEAAIAEADAILFLTSARDGVTAADEDIADVLRRSDKPVFLVANKADSDTLAMEAMSMYSLGFDQVFPIAAEHNRGVTDLIDALFMHLADSGLLGPLVDEERPSVEPVRGGVVSRIRMCLIGRPNVGKSTLANRILGTDRMIAADQPGTTRDAIDVDFQWHDQALTLVDTAGLRRKRSVLLAVEQYSVSQAVRAVERCHLAVIVLDATQPLADQDAKIAALVDRRNRASVLAITKWDAVEKDGKTQAGYLHDLSENMPFLDHVPRVFISGLTGQRVEKLLETVLGTFEHFNKRVSTSEFNRFLAKIQAAHQPPTYRGRSLKMYYGNQIGVRPPQFAIQCNTLHAISPAYEKFLLAQIRAEWELQGTPIRLKLKEKTRKARKVQMVSGRVVESLDQVPAGTFTSMTVGEDDWDDDLFDSEGFSEDSTWIEDDSGSAELDDNDDE